MSAFSAPPEIQAVVADPFVTDICLNGPSELYVDRGKKLESAPAPTGWTEAAYREWALHLVSLTGKTWDAKHPFLDGTLPTGHRLHVAFPPLARQGILISLRRLPGARSVAADGPSRTWSDQPGYARLRDAVTRHENILVAGATGSGKTTLVNELLSHADPAERIVALEDTPELQPRHPHFVSLIARPANADGFGEVTLRQLLKQTLRMRPDRVIVGESRGEEVLDLLQGLNTGHRGCLTTVHANSARDGLRRLELLCLLHAGRELPLTSVRDLLAHGLQWVVHLERNAEGARRIREIVRVEGKEGDTLLLRPMLN
ncbi:MAG: CpaF family protein [Bacteriovoracia bacterium]